MPNAQSRSIRVRNIQAGALVSESMKRAACLLFWVFLAAFMAEAQELPNSRDPGIRNETHSPRLKRTKRVKVKRPKVEHTAQYEFYKRVEEAAKEKQRILKYLSKRQFKDHRYFGHKRIPKKRPPHKMRYCNECGVRH